MKAMHELNVAKSIFKIAQEKGQGGKIQKVRVFIGQAHYLEQSSLLTAWRNVTVGTVAEESELQIERPPMRFRCCQCNKVFVGDAGKEWRCPRCNSVRLELIGGREMEVISLTEEGSSGN